MDAAQWVKLSSVSAMSFVDLTTVLVFIVVFLSLLFLNWTPSTDIPGPFALPLVGNLIQFIRMGRKRHIKLMSLHKKYGDVFRMYIGPYLVVFICGYENIHDAFVKHAAQFTNRPSWLRDIERRIKRNGHGKLNVVIKPYTFVIRNQNFNIDMVMYKITLDKYFS